MRVLLENECLLVAGGNDEEKEKGLSCEEIFKAVAITAGAAAGAAAGGAPGALAGANAGALAADVLAAGACEAIRSIGEEESAPEPGGGTSGSNREQWIANGRLGPRIYGPHEFIVPSPNEQDEHYHGY